MERLFIYLLVFGAPLGWFFRKAFLFSNWNIIIFAMGFLHTLISDCQSILWTSSIKFKEDVSLKVQSRHGYAHKLSGCKFELTWQIHFLPLEMAFLKFAVQGHISTAALLYSVLWSWSVREKITCPYTPSLGTDIKDQIQGWVILSGTHHRRNLIVEVLNASTAVRPLQFHLIWTCGSQTWRNWWMVLEGIDGRAPSGFWSCTNPFFFSSS